MEKLIALFKLYILRKLDLGQLTNSFDKLEADLDSFCSQQVKLQEAKLKKSQKILEEVAKIVEDRERAKRIADKIKALTE